MYIWEAHDGETWSSWPEFKDIEEPTNLQERIDVYEMYRNAENVTIPALIDDPDGGGDDPGLWANSIYDSDPTTIYLIGTDTTFKYLVEFALMGWQMSYDELDLKIQELLENTSNNFSLNNKIASNEKYSISNNKIIMNNINTFSLKIFNLQGKEIISLNNRNDKQIDLSDKLSKGRYLLNIEFTSGKKLKDSILIR